MQQKTDGSGRQKVELPSIRRRLQAIDLNAAVRGAVMTVVECGA